MPKWYDDVFPRAAFERHDSEIGAAGRRDKGSPEYPVRCGLEFFGPRNVVFASGAPFLQIERLMKTTFR